MTSTLGGFASILLPEQVQELLVIPAINGSIYGQMTTLLPITSTTTRIPVVTQDASASWTAEGSEISPSDATVSEVECVPAKLAGLSIVTNELANDSNPAAINLVGQSLARDISRKLDQAFFSGMASPAPAGLATLAGISTVSAPLAWQNLDPFISALGLVEAVHADVSAWAMNPGEAVLLAQVKAGSALNTSLLSPDPTSPTGRSILGRPVFVTPSVPNGVVYGIDRTRTYLIVREAATVEADSSPFFSSDRTAIRAVIRACPGFAHPASSVRITRASS